MVGTDQVHGVVVVLLGEHKGGRIRVETTRSAIQTVGFLWVDEREANTHTQVQRSN